jgi:hypothetical protein
MDEQSQKRTRTSAARRNRSEQVAFQDNPRTEFQENSWTEPAGQSSNRSDQAPPLSDVAAETVRVVAEVVSSQAKNLASNVADELAGSAKAGVTKGAEAMLGFSRAIEAAAAELQTRSPQIAERVRGAANQVQSLSDNIRNRSVAQLFSAAQDLAHKQPAAFIAGAVVAGFALSRFVKSTAADRRSVEVDPAFGDRLAVDDNQTGGETRGSNQF